MNKNVYLPIGLLIVLSGWYAFVLSLPELADEDGQPAWPQVVKANMIALAESGKSYEEMQTSVDSLRWSGQGIVYTPELTRDAEDSWVLVARPDKTKKYARGFIARLVWLNYHQYTIYTYRIRPGMQYPDEWVEGDGSDQSLQGTR